MSIKVIAGKYKGTLISVPSSARPTLSRSRKSLFDMLETLSDDGVMGSFFHDKVVLDCFAGSGALGIEALSRGAHYIYFVDKNKEAISVLRLNLTKINSQQSSSIIFSDVLKLNKFNRNKKCDLVFFDPPYMENVSIPNLITVLSESGWIAKDAIFIVETHSKSIVLEEENSELTIIKSKKIGNSLFTIIRRIY